MADYELNPDNRGLYELALTGGESLNINIHPRPGYARATLTITHHNGDAPIYFAQADEDVTPADTDAQMLMPSTWADIEVWTHGDTARLTFTSTRNATISIARA